LAPRKEARFQEQNPGLHSDRQSDKNREVGIYARGIIIGIGIGFRSGDDFDRCSFSSKSVGPGEYFTTSSTEPKLFLSNRTSSTIFLNDGRMAGSLCQQTWSSSCSAGVLNRESGMDGRVLSSKYVKVKSIKWSSGDEGTY
jgi:hypothetical protein